MIEAYLPAIAAFSDRVLPEIRFQTSERKSSSGLHSCQKCSRRVVDRVLDTRPRVAVTDPLPSVVVQKLPPDLLSRCSRPSTSGAANRPGVSGPGARP
jgi:hypothetical protein